MKVKHLEAKALRGLRDFDITLDGKSLLLWGENGSGKSSVIDALEFLFTGGIKHLEGTQGLSLRKHGPHVEFDVASMSVAATFDPGGIAVSRSLSVAPEIPDTLRTTWAVAKNGKFILRRSQLLEFIYADPADRFRNVGSLIGIDELDGVELAMKRVRDRLDGELQEKTREATRTKTRLAEAAATAGASLDDATDSINKDAVSLGLTPISALTDIPQKGQEWLLSAKQADQVRIGLLDALRREAEAVVPSDLAIRLTRYREAFSKLRSQRDAINRLSEAAFLEHGQTLLESSRAPVCPLCEQSIDLSSTLARVRQRRRVLQELSTEFGEFRKICQELATATASLGTRLTSLSKSVPVDLDVDSSLRKKLSALAAQFNKYSVALRSSPDLKASCDTQEVTETLISFEAIRKTLLDAAKNTLSGLAQTERDKAIFKLLAKATDLDRLGRDLLQQTAELNRTKELQKRATYVFDTFVACKKDEVNRVYRTIERDVRKYYEQLHPGELHRDFQLILTAGRRASTELRIKAFEKEHVDPRALTSEGHLDSLGLCIFLAFVKTFTSGWPFIVLDDVIMSIDSSHRGRVASLLLTEFKDWQLIITTHDEIWFEEFARHERACGLGGRFLNTRIRRWSLAEGTVLEAYRPRWERIEKKLADADKTGAANDTRQSLEWLLKDICASTVAPVPFRRDGRYTVAELIGPARQRLDRLLPSKRTEVQAIFSEIEAASTPGNLLSHDNPDALSLSVEEIRRFYTSVKALFVWFTCPSCHEAPSYVQQAKMLRCMNPHCKEPLEWKTS